MATVPFWEILFPATDDNRPEADRQRGKYRAKDVGFPKDRHFIRAKKSIRRKKDLAIRAKWLFYMVGPAGFEPATKGL